ncbi:efflux RND transporter permease subunit [Dokdonella sp.]|uniref:efflux RND transporter permease subunit n=1 Tax=Dokdonella sp. TaxID=2291710 RepID=UPI003528B2DD
MRLEDVANVVLGAEDYNSFVAINGKQSVFIGINAAPDANVLDVAERVRNVFPEIEAQLPSRPGRKDRLRRHRLSPPRSTKSLRPWSKRW